MAADGMLRILKPKTVPVASWIAVLVAVLALASPAWSQALVSSLTSSSDELSPAEQAALKCLGGTTGTLSASRLTVDYKEPILESITLSWAATIPSTCSGISLYISSQALPRTGTMTVQPVANTRYTLRARSAVGSNEIAAVYVTVNLPKVITIKTTTHRMTMIQALATEGETVYVNNDVNMDLSYMYIQIARNVLFQGGRTPRIPGPRLFTSVTQPVLFEVVGDDVRITGLRIEGAEMGVSDVDHGAIGILTDSNVNVEIDHNEISGWSSTGVMVFDKRNLINPRINPHAVRIHDNYIHHNQHIGAEGYGVAVQYGAHALITRNVFEWNRHSIEGDGRDGSGYEATSNLVLKNGGLHRWIPFPGVWVHTHQFDMHATDNCGITSWFDDSQWNCGGAGYVMYIRNNTFLYTNGPSIKLRGTPLDGMYVGANVFASTFLVNTVINGQSVAGTVQQNESGLVIEPGNVTGYDGSTQLGTCDFDGDGVNDSFMATGATWWFSSGGNGPWTYLNTSVKRLSEVSLGFFDGDNRCDVRADGVVYSGGMPPTMIPVGGFNGTFSH